MWRCKTRTKRQTNREANRQSRQVIRAEDTIKQTDVTCQWACNGQVNEFFVGGEGAIIVSWGDDHNWDRLHFLLGLDLSGVGLGIFRVNDVNNRALKCEIDIPASSLKMK